MPALQPLTKTINGIETTIAMLSYADRIFFAVTQLGKIGNLQQVSIPSTAPSLPPLSSTDGVPHIEPSPAIEVTQLSGSAQTPHMGTLYSLYATHIATLLWTLSAPQVTNGDDRRNVVVGLALKKSQDTSDDDAGLSVEEQTTYKGLMQMIVEYLHGTD